MTRILAATFLAAALAGGWVHVATPPIVIVRIYEPHRYLHYRPHGYVVRHRPAPSHSLQRPKVRDHRR